MKDKERVGGQERESNVEVSVSIWMFTILFSVIVRKRDAMARCSVSELIITTTTTRTTTTLTIKPKKKKKKKKKKRREGLLVFSVTCREFPRHDAFDNRMALSLLLTTSKKEKKGGGISTSRTVTVQALSLQRDFCLAGKVYKKTQSRQEYNI